jgi:hypothetical protein
MPCQKCKTDENVSKMELLGRLVCLCQKCFVQMMSPQGVSTSEHYFTTPTADQGKAMDEAAAYGSSQPWDMSSIFWTHQNDAGHHCFTITYLPKLNSKTTTDGMD